MYGKWPDYFTQSPYFPPESAEWLVAKGPKNIGFDFFEEYCARLPEFTSEDFPMHRVILGAGVVIMEGLTSLGALPKRRVDFAAPFYKIAATEGAPARFFAVACCAPALCMWAAERSRWRQPGAESADSPGAASWARRRVGRAPQLGRPGPSYSRWRPWTPAGPRGRTSPPCLGGFPPASSRC